MTPREKQLMALRKAEALRHRENKVFGKKKRFSKSPKKPKVTTLRFEKHKGALRYRLELPIKYSSLSGERKADVKAAYICLQRERCFLCGGDLYGLPKHLVENPNYMAFCYGKLNEKYPLQLHHDHETGLTLGVAHAECNSMCGLLEESEV